MATILGGIRWSAWFPILGRVTIFPQLWKICDVQKVCFPAPILHLFDNTRYKCVIIWFSFKFFRVIFWLRVLVTPSSFIPRAIPAISVYSKDLSKCKAFISAHVILTPSPISIITNNTTILMSLSSTYILFIIHYFTIGVDGLKKSPKTNVGWLNFSKSFEVILVSERVWPLNLTLFDV